MLGKNRFAGIKAILFDIDDTLFPSTEFAHLARKNAIRAMIDAGLEVGEKKAQEELERIISRYGSNFGNHFGMLASKFKSKDKNHVIAAGIWAYHNTKASISPYPNVARTLIGLREKGYLLAVASEGKAIKQWDKLIRLGIDSIFHQVFVTDSAGEGKRAAFYLAISKKLKIKPENILMVGDNPKKDILPAKMARMKTIRIMQGKHKGEKADADAKKQVFGRLQLTRAEADAKIARIEEIMKVL